MAKESNFQTTVRNYLKAKGCFVMVIQPQAGIPDGTPDVVALCDGGGWITLEVKKENPYKRDGSARAHAFQPLQQLTIKRLNDMFYSRVVYPENWNEIKAELDKII